MAAVSPEMMLRRFENCCTSDEMVGREDEESVGNVGSEHESVSSEFQTQDGNYEDVEVGMS
jgi:hypothetical protein